MVAPCRRYVPRPKTALLIDRIISGKIIPKNATSGLRQKDRLMNLKWWITTLSQLIMPPLPVPPRVVPGDQIQIGFLRGWAG